MELYTTGYLFVIKVLKLQLETYGRMIDSNDLLEEGESDIINDAGFLQSLIVKFKDEHSKEALYHDPKRGQVSNPMIPIDTNSLLMTGKVSSN